MTSCATAVLGRSWSWRCRSVCHGQYNGIDSTYCLIGLATVCVKKERMGNEASELHLSRLLTVLSEQQQVSERNPQKKRPMQQSRQIPLRCNTASNLRHVVSSTCDEILASGGSNSSVWILPELDWWHGNRTYIYLVIAPSFNIIVVDSIIVIAPSPSQEEPHQYRGIERQLVRNRNELNVLRSDTCVVRPPKPTETT
jgi:hypothetical protein